MSPVFSFWGGVERVIFVLVLNVFPTGSHHVPMKLPKFPICSLRHSQ